MCIQTCLADGVAFAFEALGERSVVVRLLGGDLLLGLLGLLLLLLRRRGLLGLLLLLLRLRGLSALAARRSTGQCARCRTDHQRERSRQLSTQHD